MTAAPAGFIHALDALPEGSTRGSAQGRAYVATKTTFSDGKSVKLVAEQLGGTGYISLNLYKLQSGAQLYPCEMPADKVIAFVTTFRPDQDAG